MKPETIKMLLTEVPEIQEFIAFIRAEVNRLNSLEDLTAFPIGDRGLEATARIRAYQKLADILRPFLVLDIHSSASNTHEYDVLE